MSESRALTHILDQIERAKPELEHYPPVELDWYQSALDAARILVPWLKQVSAELCTYSTEVLNSSAVLRQEWKSLKPDQTTRRIHDRIENLLQLQAKLLKRINGETVSTVVTDYLLEKFPNNALAGNSRSDYPDVYLLEKDYSLLPKRKAKSKEYGAAIRGKESKPVRIPDGLEIKTARNKATIDCHFPHAGLHLLIRYRDDGSHFDVNDAMVAFLKKSDYKITKPKSKTTTLKASFGTSEFISLLS